MSYNPNIPLATDQLSVSQGQILGNFQALGIIVDGLLNLPPQGSLPASTGFNQIFAFISSFTGNEEVYIQQSSTGLNIPITASDQIANGWSYLPSGVLLKWGSSGVGGIGAFIPVAWGPTYTANPWVVLASAASTTFIGVVNAYNPTPAGFTANGSGISGPASVPFQFLIIGPGPGEP